MRTRLTFASQALAIAFADVIHARMIASFPEYAQSAARGQTTAWAIPYLDTQWSVNVKERCNVVLTRTERGAVVNGVLRG